MSRGLSRQGIIVALIACAVAGCGGGGGGGRGEPSPPPSPPSPPPPPPPPTLTLSLQAIKAFRLAWTSVPGITRYKLLEDPTGNSGFTQVGADIDPSTMSLDHIVPLYRRLNARYIVQACAETRCIDSNIVTASGPLAEAVGYFKAESISQSDEFGTSVALSADGTTLAVGVPFEDSSATGVGGNPDNDFALDSGAVYVFVRDGAGPAWIQQAYIKASNTDADDRFGHRVALDSLGSTLAVGAPDADGTGAVYVFERANSVWTEQVLLKASNAGLDDAFGDSLALSGDGRTLAVGARFEDSSGDQLNNSFQSAGAAYIFVKEPAPGAVIWRQDAYLKAFNTGAGDQFGNSVALSTDGATLAVGADHEDSGATGVNGTPDESAADSGAVYVFTRAGQWAHQAYIKASNTDASDFFGETLALSGDGVTLAVAATGEDSAATGIGGTESDEAARSAGAVYVFVRLGDAWIQQAYIKASNTAELDRFGLSLSLSADGSILAVAGPEEDSSAIGIGGDESDDSTRRSGAVYVFERSGDTWAQRAYVKPSNTSSDWFFGGAIALSGDGATVAASAIGERGSIPGVNGDQNSQLTRGAGAVYLY